MAKKRKTREQKILADLRHSFQHNSISVAPLAGKTETTFSTNAPSVVRGKTASTTTLTAYPYLAKDLAKTAILTLAIFAFQIILLALLKNHILIVPGIGY